MPKRIGSTPFVELLPQNLARDTTMRGVADALDSVLGASVRALPDTLFLAQLARDSGFENPVAMLGPMERLAALSGGVRALPEQVLDLLAWQLHVEGYEAAVSVQAKRELVQMSLLLHRRRGTPWAVRNALEIALRLPAEVRQWFEYGGRPYFFRVRLDVTGAAFGPESSRDAFRLIHDHKNVRSWLEYLETRSTQTLTHRTGLALRGFTASRSRLWFPVPATPELSIRRAAGARAVTSTRLRLHFSAPTIPEMPVTWAVGARAVTSTRLGLHFPAPSVPKATPPKAVGTASLTSTRLAFRPAA